MEAVIEPSRIIAPLPDIPEHCVICFFQDVIAELRQTHQAREIDFMRSEIGSHPLYAFKYQGKQLAVFHPGVGAPLAAGLLEEVIARGCRTFIACGGAGVLAPEIVVGDVAINLRTRTVTQDGRDVELTAREFAILELLALQRGELVTRTKIYDHIFDENDDSLSNLVEVHVSNIRKKLGKDIIKTRRGQGYIIDD